MNHGNIIIDRIKPTLEYVLDVLDAYSNFGKVNIICSTNKKAAGTAVDIEKNIHCFYPKFEKRIYLNGEYLGKCWDKYGKKGPLNFCFDDNIGFSEEFNEKTSKQCRILCKNKSKLRGITTISKSLNEKSRERDIDTTNLFFKKNKGEITHRNLASKRGLRTCFVCLLRRSSLPCDTNLQNSGAV